MENEMSEKDITSAVTNIVKRTTDLTLENLALRKKIKIFMKAFDDMNIHSANIDYENVDWQIAYHELLNIMYKAKTEIEKIT